MHTGNTRPCINGLPVTPSLKVSKWALGGYRHIIFIKCENKFSSETIDKVLNRDFLLMIVKPPENAIPNWTGS